MSYATDHMAWQQRLVKEGTLPHYINHSSVRKYGNVELPLGSALDLYTSQSNANPNSIGNAPLKEILKTLVSKKVRKNRNAENNVAEQFEKIMNSATYQTTTQTSFNNKERHTQSIVHLRNRLKSPQRKQVNKLLMTAGKEELYSPVRFPKPKPFFDQAYVAKSKVYCPSQTSSRLERSQRARDRQRSQHHHLANEERKSFNPSQSVRQLHSTKKERFNEANEDVASTRSKKSVCFLV